ncbi:hypothetical protein ACFFK0_27300 [Paenibacillus chartarius]|uniref:Uncharacterized protein n=1 Tax=Paenibacillus chartarius TaxID=747481 RepID=A0ABV6DTZ1_9BACL
MALRVILGAITVVILIVNLVVPTRSITGSANLSKDVSSLNESYKNSSDSELFPIVITIYEDASEDVFQNMLVKLLGRRAEKRAGSIYNYTMNVTKSDLKKLDTIGEIVFYSAPSNNAITRSKDLSLLKEEYKNRSDSELFPIAIRIYETASEDVFQNKLEKLLGKRAEVGAGSKFNYEMSFTKNDFSKLDAIEEINFYSVPSTPSRIH